MPAWKSVAALLAAVLLGLLFVVAGAWKITDPYGAGARMMQARVPAELSIPAAVLLGIAETFAGAMLFIPRFRRWGAWLTGGLLLVFMAYIGLNYAALQGEECSCFPWIKRAVGPGFFIGDGLMMLLALVAGAWARRSGGLRAAALILGAVCVFATVSYGVNYARQTGVKAPDSITVDGEPQSLQYGRIFLYFFDPECSHCYQAAQKMAKYEWDNVKIIAVPTAQPRFAQGFLKDTGLKAAVSHDTAVLRNTFSFTAGPYGVALENGRQKRTFLNFDGSEPMSALRELGFIR